jgi:hypothetical protein
MLILGEKAPSPGDIGWYHLSEKMSKENQKEKNVKEIKIK